MLKQVQHDALISSLPFKGSHPELPASRQAGFQGLTPNVLPNMIINAPLPEQRRVSKGASSIYSPNLL